MSDTIYEGVVQKVFPDRGFGFITSKELDGELYFRLKDGEHITFDAEQKAVVGYCDQKPERLPDAGDLVLFRLHTREDGRVRANPWGLQQEYKRAVATMQSMAA